MESLRRLAILMAVTIGVLFGTIGSASAEPVDTDHVVDHGPCQPGYQRLIVAGIDTGICYT